GERGAGGERHEIDLLAGRRGRLGQTVAHFRQHREARGHADVILARHVEPAEVLRSEVGVAAHVDHIDAVDVVVSLQLLDGACDDTSRYDALAESRLVGHQESARAVLGAGAVEAVDDVIDGRSLEALQPSEHSLDIHAAHDAPPSSRCAAHTRCQSSSKPSGSTSCSSPCWRTKSTMRRTSASPACPSPTARMSASNNPAPVPGPLAPNK